MGSSHFRERIKLGSLVGSAVLDYFDDRVDPNRLSIAGDMDAMHGAMRQLKIQVPLPNDYPRSLDAFLHRRIWKSTLGAIEQAIVSDAGAPVFVKPAQRQKSFTGRVFTSIDDFWYIGGVSRRQEVWCSYPVIWRSGFRAYVIDDEIVSIDHYAGDAEAVLNHQDICAAIPISNQSSTGEISPLANVGSSL